MDVFGTLCGRLNGVRLGLDGSPTLATAAASGAEGFPSSAGDASSLPFRDACFDLVVAFMSLHDMDDLIGALAEAASSMILPPGYGPTSTRPPQRSRSIFWSISL